MRDGDIVLFATVRNGSGFSGYCIASHAGEMSDVRDDIFMAPATVAMPNICSGIIVADRLWSRQGPLAGSIIGGPINVSVRLSM